MQKKTAASAEEKKAKTAAKKTVKAKSVKSSEDKASQKEAVEKTKKTAVAKNAKAKKTEPAEDKGFSKTDLEEIVEMLEEMRADILESIEEKQNFDLESGSGGDEADIASRTLNNEMLYELASSDRIKVRDIEAALTKIQKGTYGLCEHCKKPIERKRILFMPYARYCVACQNGSEASRRKME